MPYVNSLNGVHSVGLVEIERARHIDEELDDFRAVLGGSLELERVQLDGLVEGNVQDELPKGNKPFTQQQTNHENLQKITKKICKQVSFHINVRATALLNQPITLTTPN